MTFRWFVSRTVRQAAEMIRQMDRLVREQSDLLSAEAINALRASMDEARAAVKAGASAEQLKAEMKKLEQAAAKWLKPYSHPSARENVKEFLVAVVVILAFTTFFLQLTKIPTGSMQPTLYGITYVDLRNDPDFKLPPLWKRFALYWTQGISYKYLIAPFDGQILDVDPPQTILPFVKRQKVVFGDANDRSRKKSLHIWFPPDDRLPGTLGLQPGQPFKKGQPIVIAKAIAGDHLLVDRFTYNFRQPKRGEIIVFKTRGIRGLVPDVLYIKRLVALSGENVRISNKRRLVINGAELTAGDRHFEYVYTFDSKPGDSKYIGHVNEAVGRREFGRTSLAPLFPDENAEYVVSREGYLAMGDNTLNSLDSRAWGELPKRNVIGRCWFVYWPFTERFGWGYR